MKAYGSKLILFFFSMLIVTSSLAADDANVARNIAFYSNLWDEIINHGKLEMINDQNFVPAVIVHASPENITGIDAMKAYYANYLTGFSDIEFSINDIFGQGNKLVKYWTFKGTHTGDFFGIAGPWRWKASPWFGSKEGGLLRSTTFSTTTTSCNSWGSSPKNRRPGRQS